MPLYEYECAECEQRLEAIQRFSDPLETICPSCGGPLKKLFSAPAIQFKGSGFYKTDYTKTEGSAKKSEGDAAPAKSESDSSGAPAKSESKSEKSEKSESKSEKSEKSESKSDVTSPASSSTHSSSTQ